MQHVCAGWLWSRVGSDMSVSHIFPQGVLAAFTFVGSGAEIEVLEPAPSVSWALSSVQCGQHQPLRDRSRSQVAGTEAQRVRSKLAPSLLCVCYSPPSICTPTSAGSNAGAREVGAWCGVELWLFSSSRTWTTPCAAFASTSNGCPCPIQIRSRSASALSCTAVPSPWPPQHFS